MASIKELKNEIKSNAYELINECMLYRHFHPEQDTTANKVISEIIKARQELIYRINHPEPNSDSKKLKTHFQKIRKDLNNMHKLVDKLGKK